MRIEWNGIDITEHVVSFSTATKKPIAEAERIIKKQVQGQIEFKGYFPAMADFIATVWKFEREERAAREKVLHQQFLRRKIEWLVDRALLRYRLKTTV
jgi:hypothetical protein